MKIEVEGSDLVIKKGFFTKRYPLCSDLHVDYGEDTIHYKDKCIYNGKKKLLEALLLSKTFGNWESYLLSEKYMFEWKTCRGVKDAMQPIALSDVEAYGDRMAELFRGKAEALAKEILGPEYEVRVDALKGGLHYIAGFNVYKDGQPMCADDEIFAELMFEGYWEPDKMHLVTDEIVLPVHQYPAQGIYEAVCMTEDQISLEYYKEQFEEMKEKGIVSMEKFRYLEERKAQK